MQNSQKHQKIRHKQNMNIKKDVERRKFQTVSDDITIMFMNNFNPL